MEAEAQKNLNEASSFAFTVKRDHLKAPSLLANLTEFRSAPLILTSMLRWKSLAVDADGKGRPVMLVPGFQSWQWSLEPMRRFLLQNNFRAMHWGLGRNNGDVPELLPQLIDMVKDFAQEAGRPVALVGWSLGGYLGRETARDLPELVDEVITFGTGAWGGPKYTFAAPYYKFRGQLVDDIEVRTFERYQIPLQQPVTAFYSKSDGIINWECCIDHWSPNVTHIEIDCPHMGMPVFSEIVSGVAKILSVQSR